MPEAELLESADVDETELVAGGAGAGGDAGAADKKGEKVRLPSERRARESTRTTRLRAVAAR